MKKVLQILTTAVAGALLMGSVVGATGSTSKCDIYQKGSASYKSCLNNTTKTSVRVVCVNNVYVINNNSQQAGTGNATIVGNGSGGYAASGNAENTSGSTVTIGATGCGKSASTGTTTTTPTSGGKGAGTTTGSTAPAQSSAAAAASLPETGSNTLVNAAIIGTALVIGGLVISYVGTALYRRAALKQE